MNKMFTRLFLLVVGLFAALGFASCASPKVGAPPTNSATLQFEHLWLTAKRAFARAAMQVSLGLDRVFGMRTPFALGITADEQILKSLTEIQERFKKFDGVAEEMKLMKEEQGKVSLALTEAQKQLLAFQKYQIENSGNNVRRSHDGLSDLTAKYLGGLYLLGEVQQRGQLMSGDKLKLYRSEIKSILNLDIESKTALTTSDIPLPTGYSGDIVELVYQYGVARKVGTVLPLGSGTFKLPKLSTSPTFALVATSSGGAEKSPQFGWATFAAEKFGGIIRMPSEIEEDSIVGMGQFLARYSARQMAQVEDYNFFRSSGAASGQDGTGEGLTKSVVTDSKFVYNGGGSSTSGKTKPSDMTLADLRSLRTLVHGAAIARGKYFFHPTYESALVAFNGNTNGVVYVRGSLNQPATLDGFEIVWVPDMPAYSTSATVSVVHALFGDATFNYLGVRGSFRFDTSREAGFTTDEVLVRALERFTVQKVAVDCVAGLRCTAS